MDMDVDDENDWKAMDSDEEEAAAAIQQEEEPVERDDDIDIGFRSHQFSYGRKRKRSRRENQDEAIYGVFNDGSNNNNRNRTSNSYSDNAAPMFVPASSSRSSSKRETQSAPLFVAATNTESDANQSSAPIFVAASKSIETNTKAPSATTTQQTDSGGSMFVAASTSSKPNDPKTKSETTPIDADTKETENEEEQHIAQEQKEADDRFLALLEKAKARNKKTRTRSRPPLPSTTTMPSNEGSSGLGMTQGLGLPSSFGASGGGGGLGFSSPTEAEAAAAEDQPMEKDPTVGTWEKHTKGFGSKLLAKMGWKGSGGLGSNRRSFRGESESNTTAAAAAAAATILGESTTQNNNTTAPPPTTKVKKGISRPVEVVVRPNSMGLGFGNFKESSQLKANRRIEAEVRGIDYNAQLAEEKKEARAKRRQQRNQRYGNPYDSSSSEDEDDDAASKRNSKSSAIPTTDDLLSEQSWKAKRSKTRGKYKSGLPEIIPYQELIQRQKQSSSNQDDKVVIIDMRGPSSTSTAPKTTSSPTTVVALGQELLYNLSFLLGTYENKLHSSSRHYETSVVRSIEGLDHQVQDAEDKLVKAAERRTKLAKAHQIAEQVRTEVSDPPSSSQRKRVQTLVSELKNIFTPSERKELQFWTVLAPTLLGPSMESLIENWKPFFGDHYGASERNFNRSVVDSFFEWGFLDEKEGRILCESMVKNQLIPRLKADIESQAMGVWDPVTNPYAVLDLYEYIRAKALAFDNKYSVPHSGSLRNGGEPMDDDPNQVFPSNKEEDTEEESSSKLAVYIQNVLIREAVYPKLLTAITNWKPNVVEDRRLPKTIPNPLHSWVLPWLPHSDHPILLPNLLVECKRKLKHALLALQRGRKTLMTDNDVKPILDTLRPWSNILDNKSLQKMVMEETNFAGCYTTSLRLAFNGRPGTDKAWKRWQRLLFELHGYQLLSDIDFLSLVETFLEHWATFILYSLGDFYKVHLPLNELRPENTLVMEQVVEAYRECKIHIFLDPYHGQKDESFPSYSRSLQLLRNDTFICHSFYGVAKIIQILDGGNTNGDLVEELEIFVKEDGFHNIRKRRFMESAEKTRAKAMGESRGETRAKAVLRKRNILEPTFREVVEAFAADRGVIFRPKSGLERDGKPIYLFGNKSIYLEGDVVFYQDDRNRNVSWRPISLDQLGAMAS